MRVYLEHILDPILESSKCQRLAVLGGLLAMQITAYYAVLYGPQSARIENLSRHLARLQVQPGPSIVASQRASLEHELAALDQRLGEEAFQLPEREPMASLLATITKAARAAELAVLALRPRPERISEFYTAVPVDVVLMGAYQNLFNFLQELNHPRNPLHLTKIQIERATALNGEATLRTSAQITALRQLPEKGEENPEGAR